MDFNQRDKIGETPLPKGFEAGIGLGVTALVLGLLSIGLAIFIIGAGIGLIGLILSAIHLTRRLPMRKIAIAALVLSLIGTASGIGIGAIVAASAYRAFTSTQEHHNSEFSDFYGIDAPDVNFKIIDGNIIKLSDLKGKRVILDFWATWCPPCQKEIPNLIKLRQETSPDKLVIIGISSESRDKIEKFAGEHKINYPLAGVQFYGDLPEPFNEVTAIPTLFVIDANGTIETVLSGYQSFNKLKEYALGDSK